MPSKTDFLRACFGSNPQLFPSGPFGKSLGKARDLDDKSQISGIAIRSTFFFKQALTPGPNFSQVGHLGKVWAKAWDLHCGSQIFKMLSKTDFLQACSGSSPQFFPGGRFGKKFGQGLGP